MPSVCTPKNIIRTSKQWEVTRHHNGRTADIVETILYADAQSGDFIIPDGLYCLMGADDYETARNVWHFVKNNLRYQPDRPGHERVKSPGALFASRVGDCKSFSIAVGALLRAFGIPYFYRFTAYEPGDVTHVYVVAEAPDYGQIILDTVHSRFDSEVPYYRREDVRPRLQSIPADNRGSHRGVAGLRGWSIDFTGLGLILAAVAVGLSLLTDNTDDDI